MPCSLDDDRVSRTNGLLFFAAEKGSFSRTHGKRCKPFFSSSSMFQVFMRLGGTITILVAMGIDRISYSSIQLVTRSRH